MNSIKILSLSCVLLSLVSCQLEITPQPPVNTAANNPQNETQLTDTNSDKAQEDSENTAGDKESDKNTDSSDESSSVPSLPETVRPNEPKPQPDEDETTQGGPPLDNGNAEPTEPTDSAPVNSEPETPKPEMPEPEMPEPEMPESEMPESEHTAPETSTPTEADDPHTLNEYEQTERQLTNFPAMDAVKAAIATRANSIVENIEEHSATNPSNVKRVESIINSADWEYLFPVREPVYSYENLLKAVAKFPAFCGDYTDGRDAEAICARSLATVFAHFTQETGGHSAGWRGIDEEWRQGLVHVREMGWDETMRGGYNGECAPELWQGATWPCGTFANGDYKSYFGRGAKQLSYNYNYGPFSEAMFGDVQVLLNEPELVADTWLNLASAIFFFTYPQPPKPSMLHIIDGTWQANQRDIDNGLIAGFGVTTQVINGGVECGGSVEVAQSVNRIAYFKAFSQYLNNPIPADEILGCAGMKQFDAQGAGAVKIYWEQDWSYVAENPDGGSFACQLVGYQTPFSAFKAGDYQSCVEHHFGNNTQPIN